VKISILIPVYNEADTLSAIIGKILSLNINKELIIVDDGSADGSRQILQNQYRNCPDVKVIFHKKNMGKGVAIKTALNVATGDVAIIQDADMEYDPLDYLKLIEPIKNGTSGVVYGSRFLITRKTTSFWHFLVNKFLTSLTNILFSSKLSDMETCYKMMRTDIFKNLDIQSQHFEIEVEITAKLLKKKYPILEVPISYKGRSYHEGKKIGWKDGFIAIWALLKYRFF
jgi:glycosyltransferase involved in cell wall biosynthesis